MASPLASPGGGARSCPGCHAAMQRRAFPSRGVSGTVDLDLCMDCRVIWFDAFESAQLTPGAVLQLFDVIQKAGDTSARPLPESCACPACRHALALTHDIERTNHITYYRCEACHGRLTTFMQFLREKEFVRSLSPVEVMKLRAVVATVRCTSCGAPIDLGRDAACPYCRAPIAILDPDAVGRTVAQLTTQEKSRLAPVPDRRIAVEALLTLPGEAHTPDIVQDVLQLLFDAVHD
jgi:hypothetical protein